MTPLDSFRRFTIYSVIVSQLGLTLAGCRVEGTVPSAGSRGGSGSAATAQLGASLGEIVFRIYRRNLELSATADATAKVGALDARHQEFVTAVDTVVPATVLDDLSSTLDEVRRFIDDGTLPTLTDQVASILELVANDPQDPQKITQNALATLANARSAIDKDQAMKLASRMLAYPELERLLKSIATLVDENTGQNAAGQPNGKRDLVSELLSLLSRRLVALPRPTPGAASAQSAVVTTLLEPIELRGSLQMGAPAWSVRADANGNPAVNVDPQTRALYAPYRDANRDGAADVDAAGDAVDASGAKIDLRPFGSQGARDAEGRALAADGRLLFSYFDAKKTTLAQVLLLAGKLVERDVPLDLLKAADACATRRTDTAGNTVYADDNPMLDVAWGGLEVFRFRDAPKLLETMAALIKNDPRRAERILIHLVNVIKILDRTQFQGGQGTKKLLDDLIPLLSRVFNSNGSGQNAADQLAVNILNTFRDQFRQVRGIPRGLAGMMKYSIYPGTDPANPNGRVVGPNEKSCLEQLMDMMVAANGCTVPIIGGNMADFYLDSMAGNKKIVIIRNVIEFDISVYTINQLIDIPILRNLMCSAIRPEHVRALQAFAQSGALNALIPIVKAFSDRGQTSLIRNIFLTLGANYPAAMRPNEGVLVQVLESGVAEELLDALNSMTTMTVPSTGEPVTDVTARFLAAMVDINRGVYDRKGVRHTTLLHLVLDPLQAMNTRIDQRGVRPILDRAMSNVIDVLLETAQVAPAGSSVGYEGLLYHGLIKLTASSLDAAAKAMSVNPTVRSADITRYQGDVISLMTGRDVPVLVDVLLAINSSSASADIKTSLVNVFTPNISARTDVYGALLEILSAVIQAKADPGAMVDALKFLGKVLDPARGLSKPLVRSLMKLISGDNVLLTLVKNALDRGPSGTGRSPAETLLSILDDVNGHAAASGPVTAADVAAGAQKIADFIRNKDKGLEALYTQLRGRPR